MWCFCLLKGGTLLLHRQSGASGGTMSMSVHVHLLSGQSVTLETEPEVSIDCLTQLAQSALGVGRGRLLTTSGCVLAQGTVLGAGLQNNDVLTLHVGQVRVLASKVAGGGRRRPAAFASLFWVMDLL